MIPVLAALVVAPAWQTFKADGISVLMPAKTQTQDQPPTPGDAGVKTRLYVSMAPPLTAVISRSTLPAGFPAGQMGPMQEGMKMGFLRSTGATTTADRPMTYAGRKGRQIDFKTANGAMGSMWIVPTPKVVYSLTLVKAKGSPGADTQKFFSSLRLP